VKFRSESIYSIVVVDVEREVSRPASDRITILNGVNRETLEPVQLFGMSKPSTSLCDA
jgi:hypothetical protein